MLWYSLPENIRYSSNIAIFKSKLKKYFLEKQCIESAPSVLNDFIHNYSCIVDVANGVI